MGCLALLCELVGYLLATSQGGYSAHISYESVKTSFPYKLGMLEHFFLYYHCLYVIVSVYFICKLIITHPRWECKDVHRVSAPLTRLALLLAYDMRDMSDIWCFSIIIVLELFSWCMQYFFTAWCILDLIIATWSLSLHHYSLIWSSIPREKLWSLPSWSTCVANAVKGKGKVDEAGPSQH